MRASAVICDSKRIRQKQWSRSARVRLRRRRSIRMRARRAVRVPCRHRPAARRPQAACAQRTPRGRRRGSRRSHIYRSATIPANATSSPDSTSTRSCPPCVGVGATIQPLNNSASGATTLTRRSAYANGTPSTVWNDGIDTVPCRAAGSKACSVPSRSRTKSLTLDNAAGSGTRKCRNALAAGNDAEIRSTSMPASMKSVTNSGKASSRPVRPSPIVIPINCRFALSYANANASARQSDCACRTFSLSSGERRRRARTGNPRPIRKVRKKKADRKDSDLDAAHLSRPTPTNRPALGRRQPAAHPACAIA